MNKSPYKTPLQVASDIAARRSNDYIWFRNIERATTSAAEAVAFRAAIECIEALRGVVITVPGDTTGVKACCGVGEYKPCGGDCPLQQYDDACKKWMEDK